ncbi:MAG: sigma-70 family RNA polymerase sigma factor [Acidobacteriota bacterium]
MKLHTEDITQLLDQLHRGNEGARSQLIPLVYQELHRIASRYMLGERPGHTLQTTALVHEAYLRLLGGADRVEWRNRVHFFAVAATLMRRVLVDYARSRGSIKRGGDHQRVDFEAAATLTQERLDEVLAVDEALSRLSEWAPRQSHMVELRFFGGLTFEEIAEALDVSVRTLKRDWRLARSWLRAQLSSGGPE